MGRKLGLTLDDVVTQAAEIADRDGLDQLSLASVASGLGVRSPSLYNHVDGLPGLRRQLAMRAGRLMAGDMADAVCGLAPIDALRAIAATYRRFALAHPGLYASTLPAPTPEQDPEVADALAAPVKLVASVLESMGVDLSEAIPLIRALRSSIHGFVDIELGGGFGLPDDIDESFTTTIDLVVSAIAARSSMAAS
jgi:AcrR family transcriptional regulator